MQVVVYIMLCGCNPFNPYGAASDARILAAIAAGKVPSLSLHTRRHRRRQGGKRCLRALNVRTFSLLVCSSDSAVPPA